MTARMFGARSPLFGPGCQLPSSTLAGLESRFGASNPLSEWDGLNV